MEFSTEKGQTKRKMEPGLVILLHRTIVSIPIQNINLMTRQYINSKKSFSSMKWSFLYSVALLFNMNITLLLIKYRFLKK